MQTPWAVLLCKFRDRDDEPYPREFYERLFTASGVGSRNMVEFWRDVSHGAVDMSGSQVFGWLELSITATAYWAGGVTRDALVRAALVAATDARVPLSQFFAPVICLNVPADLFGGFVAGTRCTVTSSDAMDVSALGHEMGHAYGLDHSWLDEPRTEYGDRWDIMSYRNTWTAPHPEYRFMGPGLNAANMRGRGWLDESRVWRAPRPSYDVTVQLRPLLRRDLPGFLAADVGPRNEYVVEFRVPDQWDSAIPRPAILVHRFAEGRSYMLQGTNGQRDLVAGDTFEMGSVATSTEGEVVSIDAAAQVATIRVRQRPVNVPERWVRWPIQFEVVRPSEAERDDGLIVSGGQATAVPAGDALAPLVQQMMLYKSVGQVSLPWSRDAIRREALTELIAHAERLRAGLNDVFIPCPPYDRKREPSKQDQIKQEQVKQD